MPLSGHFGSISHDYKHKFFPSHSATGHSCVRRIRVSTNQPVSGVIRLPGASEQSLRHRCSSAGRGYITHCTSTAFFPTEHGKPHRPSHLPDRGVSEGRKPQSRLHRRIHLEFHRRGRTCTPASHCLHSPRVSGRIWKHGLHLVMGTTGREEDHGGPFAILQHDA